MGTIVDYAATSRMHAKAAEGTLNNVIDRFKNGVPGKPIDADGAKVSIEIAKTQAALAQVYATLYLAESRDH